VRSLKAKKKGSATDRKGNNNIRKLLGRQVLGENICTGRQRSHDKGLTAPGRGPICRTSLQIGVVRGKGGLRLGRLIEFEDARRQKECRIKCLGTGRVVEVYTLTNASGNRGEKGRI